MAELSISYSVQNPDGLSRWISIALFSGSLRYKRNRLEALIGLPVLRCLFCKTYKTPIEFDMNLHLYENHKEELFERLPVRRAKGIDIDSD